MTLRAIVYSLLLCCLAQASLAFADPAVTLQEIKQLYADVQSGQLLPADFSKQLLAKFEDPQNLPPDLAESFDLKLKTPEVASTLANDLRLKLAGFLKEHSATEANAFRRLADLALDRESEGYRQVVRLLDLSERVELLIDKQDVVKLISLREDQLDRAEQEIIEPRLNAFLLRLASQQIAANRPDLALKYLAETNPQWAGTKLETTLDEVLTKIESLMGQGQEALQSWPFDNVRVLGMLDSPIVLQNERLKTLVAKVFSDHILDLVKTSDIEKATYYYQSTVKLRPDPSRLNDELRLKVADIATTDAARSFAAARIAELDSQGRFSLFNKLGLFWSGYYGRLPLIILGLIVILIIAAGAIFLFAPELVGLPGQNRQVKGYERNSKVEDEYSRLLALLDLDDEASDEEIKARYRQLVKELHPDSSAGETPEEKEAKAKKFVELKKGYERLMERRRSGFTREI